MRDRGMKRLAIIPARGGSKRIPNKNVRDFCGRPMIAHILSAAKESGLFTAIHVSTESRHSRGGRGSRICGGIPAAEALADDHTPIMPVLKHTVEEFARRGRRFRSGLVAHGLRAVDRAGRT